MPIYSFNTFMETLDKLGVLDVLIPFLLVFVLTYAILLKTKILVGGKDGEGGRNDKLNKKFSLIIALAIALGVVIPHVTNSYPRGADIVVIINNALPQVVLLAVIGLALVIATGLFGAQDSYAGNRSKKYYAAIALILVILIFINALSPRLIPSLCLARMY